ncbi:MAG: helix-hairpin-helix domain-containing protein [Cyclobacteriaceae bacterium]|nr:helix-hairpin-helix domain-containing protein [Cyclobacteriaceae bacterium]
MKAVACIVLCVSITAAIAQDYRKTIDLENLVDEILAGQDEDINYEDLYENLMMLVTNPLDLNKVTAEQLRGLYFLNERQVQAVLTHRQVSGAFLSEFELQALPEIDRPTFERLILFCTVKADAEQQNLWKRIVASPNNYLLLRADRTLEAKAGYKATTAAASRYAGSPNRLYTRFRTSEPGDFSMGFTAEKDAGERIVWAPNRKQYGPGFLSAHVQILNQKKIKNLIVGDYQAQFGQGLVLGSAFGIGKNAEAVTTVRRPTLGFMPYTSAYEAGYFRGAALSYAATSQLTVHGLYSTRWRDGNLQTDSTGAFSTSSLSTTGLHRTPNEIANQNTVHESNAGLIVSFNHRQADAGILLLHTQLSAPLFRNPTLYNQFYFQGKENTNGGFYFNYRLRNGMLFGEVAKTFTQGWGATTGLIASLTTHLDFALLYRNFSRNYQSFYSNALSENTTPQNERGLYWGWKYTFNKKYWVSGYFDSFRFDWLRYRGYSPSTGHEWLLRFTHRPVRHVSFFAQMREENKIRNQSAESNLYVTTNGLKRNYWLNVDYQATRNFSLRTRAQFSSYSLAGRTTRATAVLQDITIKRNRLTCSGRYALFDTDDYDNRLYVFEKDVWLAFSFPAYYGVGVRSYLLVEYTLSRTIAVWVRWARTSLTGAGTIGSGSERIIGNTRNDLKFQARIKL